MTRFDLTDKLPNEAREEQEPEREEKETCLSPL